LDAERWILGLRLPFRGGSPVTLACVPLACPARAPRDLLVTPACVEAEGREPPWDDPVPSRQMCCVKQIAGIPRNREFVSVQPAA